MATKINDLPEADFTDNNIDNCFYVSGLGTNCMKSISMGKVFDWIRQTVIDEDYEEGVLVANVPVRKKWWQFWLPKIVKWDGVKYIKIGNTVKITTDGGRSFTGEFVEGK